MFSIKRVLVPTDFSDASNAALNYARDLAGALGAQLCHLHVPGRTGENFETEAPMGAFEGTAAARPLTAADGAAMKQQFATRIGAPADEIVRYAQDRDVDLIVMATHGRSGVSHLVLGSVAEDVLRKATCPVLVIRRR